MANRRSIASRLLRARILFAAAAIGVLIGIPAFPSAVVAAKAARQPLSMDGQPEFQQRVLTLPGAVLMAEPRADAAVKEGRVPAFSILYVFDRKLVGPDSWMEVGRTVDGRSTAWVKAAQTQDWEIMLVMQYAPAGQRQRVLYFKDSAALSQLVQAPQVGSRAQELLRQVDAQQHDRSQIISIEQSEAKGTVSFQARPYLMPILSYRRDEFDSGKSTTLVQVASVNAKTAPTAEERGNAQKQPPAPDAMKVGIVFAMDTTSSMGPYIERARKVVRKLYAGLEEKKLLDRTSFGIVGYRNNMDDRPGLEYVARVFQPLLPNSSPKEVLANLDKMQATNLPTHSWDEDAIYGLHTALTETEWSPFQARIIVQITDAGMLDANDPKAHLNKVGILNIREIADREKVSIIPIHLLTPQAERQGNVARARGQYMGLGQTGDRGANKYVPIPAGSEEAFEAALEKAATGLVAAIEQSAGGKPLDRPKLAPKAGPNLDELLLNELFSAQQRYIGERQGTDAPAFFAGWAADRDLANPNLEALSVAVFLTRNQLNTLAQSLTRVLDAAKGAQLKPEDFFNQLRALAAATAGNPDQKFETILDSNLLPSYLRLLPYHSRVLRLSPQAWLDMGFTGQQAFISELEMKLQAYADVNASNAWSDLGGGDEGLKVYPMPMDLLP